jgi:ABC-2 type transport system ATP-binding protein
MVIVADNVTKMYGDHVALGGVSFEVGENQVVGFLGLNGAGKTTMLRILCGLLMPTAGRTIVHGVDGVADPLALRRLIGFLPDRPPLYPEMTVRAMLRYAAALRGYPSAKLDHRIDDVLALASLTDVQHQAVETLSHGYKQRVGIAQAIVHEPKLVVLDEPISGLDPAQIVSMRGLITGLRERHTVLLSSHILSEIVHTCDKLLVLHGGKIVAEGKPGDMAEHNRRIDMVVRGDRGTIEAALAKQAKARLWNVQLSAQDAMHRLQAEAADDEVAEAVVASLVAAGVGVRSVAVSGTGLEDVFLRLTQKPRAEAT